MFCSSMVESEKLTAVVGKRMYDSTIVENIPNFKMVLSRRHCALFPYLKVLRRATQCPWIFASSVAYSNMIANKKSKIAPLQERKMIDKFRMRAKGGDGGSGCSSFHRSRSDRRGKADGGNGGRGGDVILECSPALWDFRGVQYHAKAKRGGNGLSKNKIGSRGDDKVIQVPVGTMIHLVVGEIPSVVDDRPSKALDPWELSDSDEVNNFDSEEKTATSMPSKVKEVEREHVNRQSFVDKSTSTQKTATNSSAIPKARMYTAEYVSDSQSEYEDIESGDGVFQEDWDEGDEEEEEEEEVVQYNVAELTEPGKRIIIARGGEGGLGNVSLGKIYKSNKHADHEAADDEDQVSLSAGVPGSETVLILELKSIADVGLVGMPNAGKSTLLGAISRAKPTVGHYAFTTLRPSIGKLNYDDFFSVKVADIPGIIKGAHENRGLGHAFLRHIERTKVLAYVVDLAAALDGRKGMHPWEQLRDLVMELECHQAGLSGRPSLIVANKIDEEGAEDVYEELKRRVQGVPIFPVCAVLEDGVPELKTGLRALMDCEESQSLNLDKISID